MALQTRYRLDPLQLEPGGGETLVETAGYVPADIRIREFIEAGIRLGEYRKEAYDFGADEEVDFSAMDPLRIPGVDPAEVTQLRYQLEASMKKKTAMRLAVEDTKDEDVPFKEAPTKEGK